jgi:phosphatidylinositol 3-kinase
MTQLLKQKAMEQSLLLSASARSQNTSSSATTATNSKSGFGSGDHLSPLASFLITRACGSLPLANALYWFLKVETQDKENGSRFSLILESFLTRLRDYSGQEGSQRYKLILAQDTYVGLVIKCQQDAKEVSGAQPVKQAELRKLLAERQMNRISVHGLTAIPDPLRPYIRVTGLNPSSARMFKSAVYPCMLEFDVLGGKVGNLSPRGMYVCLYMCVHLYIINVFAYLVPM